MFIFLLLTTFSHNKFLSSFQLIYALNLHTKYFDFCWITFRSLNVVVLFLSK